MTPERIERGSIAGWKKVCEIVETQNWGNPDGGDATLTIGGGMKKTLRERLEQYVYIEPQIAAKYSEIQAIRNSKVAGGAVMASMTESPWILHPVSEVGMSDLQRKRVKILYSEIQKLLTEGEELREVVNETAKAYDPIVSLALYWYYLSGEGMTWEDVAGKIHYPNQGRALQKKVERFFIKMSQMSPLSQTRAV